MRRGGVGRWSKWEGENVEMVEDRVHGMRIEERRLDRERWGRTTTTVMVTMSIVTMMMLTAITTVIILILIILTTTAITTCTTTKMMIIMVNMITSASITSVVGNFFGHIFLN